jgi:hypothetical protein
MSGFRYNRIPGTTNKDAILSRENLVVAYAAAIALATTAEVTKIFIALTGALALTANVAKAFKGDELIVVFSADGSGRTVTPGAGFGSLTAATIVCAANKQASISFIFDGTNWCETDRAVGV